MTTIAVYVTITDEFMDTYNTIIESIPCFTDISFDEDFVHIMCRCEDAAWVEKMLAPYV